MNNEDGNVAEPTAKKPKKSSKTPQLPPMECKNCQALFEDEEKYLDHVEVILYFFMIHYISVVHTTIFPLCLNFYITQSRTQGRN